MYPTTSLQPGSTNTAAVQQLQNWLVANGYMTQAQVNTGYGTYGPQTTQAVQKAQQALGVDNSSGPGYWGPKTIAAVSGQSSQGNNQVIANQQAAAALGVSIPGVGEVTSQPKNQQELDAQYSNAVVSHPAFTASNADQIQNAIATGNWDGVINSQGQPFSAADTADAVSQAQSEYNPGFQQQQTKETADTEASLQAKQAEYQKYLTDQAAQFQIDKTNQDQTAANNGVLFSGGRAQKLQQLGDTYTGNNEYKKSTIGADISSTARDFGYKYGDTAANGLSSYYSLGGNTYNPNVATGGVSSGGLSSIYNANKGYGGTQVAANNIAVQQNAARKLANKGNKLVASGYTNQF